MDHALGLGGGVSGVPAVCFLPGAGDAAPAGAAPRRALLTLPRVGR